MNDQEENETPEVIDVSSNDAARGLEVFVGMPVIKGLEHLGRAIVDDAGVPSGSPANYEATRGSTGAKSISDGERARIMADLADAFPKA